MSSCTGKGTQCPRSFRPLAGISCVPCGRSRGRRVQRFPSPRGDKLCLKYTPTCRTLCRFRPLAGISCVLSMTALIYLACGFRPLAGISCVALTAIEADTYYEFPSPRGDKLCPGRRARTAGAPGFRPLAGISCVRKTAQLEPVGFGPGFDRITISHSTAAGKWQLEIKIPLIFLREPLQTAMQVAAMETRFAQSADSH